VFSDPEGLSLELQVDDSDDAPLVANAPDIPEEHRIRGFAGVRAYSSRPEGSASFLETLGFDPGWETRGESLSLPPNYEQYRSQVEQILAPLPNPRRDRARTPAGD
jgi:hypothetical protein